MSRLLHAAARKARIEHLTSKGWVKSSEVDTCERFSRFQRIHPDDAHLQYGPISTALREAAREHDPKSPLVYETVGGTWGIAMVDWYTFNDCNSKLHRSLFLLILAESLAEEGL